MKSGFSIRKALSIVFFGIMSFTAFGQEVRSINLEYTTTVNPDYAHVKVSIDSSTDSTYSLEVETTSLWLKINPETLKLKDTAKPAVRKVTITEEQYLAIANAVKRIGQENIDRKSNPSVLDGVSCSISFDTTDSTGVVNTSNPTYETAKRNLEDFLYAYQLILTTAGLDPQKLL